MSEVFSKRTGSVYALPFETGSAFGKIPSGLGPTTARKSPPRGGLPVNESGTREHRDPHTYDATYHTAVSVRPSEVPAASPQELTTLRPNRGDCDKSWGKPWTAEVYKARQRLALPVPRNTPRHREQMSNSHKRKIAQGDLTPERWAWPLR